MNKDLIPKKEAEEVKYNFNPVKWKLYARQMPRNPFMKEYILKKYNSVCQWCNKKINKVQIHHIDYAHQCVNETYITIPRPTEKRPNRVHKVPNCEKCYKENILAFNECIKKIVPVHSICNMLIENEREIMNH